MRTTGIILIIIGIILTVVTSFKFFTKEKVVDIGALEITADKPNYLSWSPILGIVIIVVGGVVLWQAKKN
ncbi:MAG: hypothetical protein IPI60_16830 [Saprospiraceae bacterium]|jgi:uncharacterized membrane protein YidH (DUF202 family)|nr:hypothetical protein [Saprospiraceae bacterium]